MSSASLPSRLQGLSTASMAQAGAIADALDAGRVQEAEQSLAQVAMADRGHPEMLRLQAGVLGMRGMHADAIATMRRALALRPGDPASLNTLGTLLGQAGDYDGAVIALRQCCELQPTLARAWYNLGVMLTRSVRNHEAAPALDRALALQPNHAEARALAADLWRMQGRVVEAAAEYRRILVDRPWAGMAWWGLADLRTEPFSVEDITAMAVARGNPHANADDIVAIGFALARAYEDHDKYADALQALADANAVARRRQPWHAAAFSAGIDAIGKAFTTASAAVDTHLGHEAIFIVGLPRSGSTLVEQILASHPAIEGAGELADLPQTLAEESHRRNQRFPDWVADMQANDWQRLGQRYLERTARWRTERPLFVDKLPGNWIYLAAIRAMLPGAHIIGCRRDPLETCLACYRQHLHNNEYTRSFTDLAAFHRDYDRVLREAARQSPRHVLEHNYEHLVADPNHVIRSLLDFCDLPFDAACLEFHRNPREVRSPSASQVRRPLRADTARAPRYGNLLDPLRHALGLSPWPA